MAMPRVRDVMTSPVIGVAPQTRLPALKHLMVEHQIRRVPVVQRHKVLGIVTLGDLRNAYPSNATALSIYELSYLLDQVTANDIMTTSVITIDADAPLAEAARLMLENKVSGMPVVCGGRLVGMVTESDVFRAVIAGQAPLQVPVVASPLAQPVRVRQPII